MPFCFSKSAVQVEEPMSTSKYEVGETAESDSALVRKFAKFLDDKAPKFEQDARYKKGLVRYKELKNHMNNMDNRYGSKMERRRFDVVEDECSICLENLGYACNVTTTACDHSFHTFCLVETLGNGNCSSCPLCRTDVSALVPTGVDGSTLKLIAKLRINIDSAEWCHKAILQEIQKKTADCLHELEGVNKWRSRVFPFASAPTKRDKLRGRVKTLIEQLDTLEDFGKINSEGFTKVCRKIDKRVSSELAEECQRKYVDEQAYHKDCVENGNGMTRALREELRCILGLLSTKPSKRGAVVAPAITEVAITALPV